MCLNAIRVRKNRPDTKRGFIEYIEDRKKDNRLTLGDKPLGDKFYDRLIDYVNRNWGDCDGVQEFLNEKIRPIELKESAWGDMRKRSAGDMLRTEDEVLNDIDIYDLNEIVSKYCDQENLSYFIHKIVIPSPSQRKENDYEGLMKYIEDRRKDESDKLKCINYDKIIRFINKNWETLDIDKFIKKSICKPRLMTGKKLVECEGVPGGATPASVGGMGAAYFPGPDGTSGSGDLPSPTGIVYHQVAPYTMFLKELKKKKKKKTKKFRKEDEPCVHSDNPPIYSHVDDFRDYVDRVYNQLDRKK